MSVTQDKVLGAIASGKHSVRDIARHTKLHEDTVRARLSELQRAGEVASHPVIPAGHRRGGRPEKHYIVVGERDKLMEFLMDVYVEVEYARKAHPGNQLQALAFSEEAGELVKAALDESADHVRKEAVQAAAMAARLVLDGDSSIAELRKKKGLDPIG